MVALASLITTAVKQVQITPIEYMVYFDIKVMGTKSIGGTKADFGPCVMKIIATHGPIGKRARGVIHVTHDNHIARCFVDQLSHDLGLPGMSLEACRNP